MDERELESLRKQLVVQINEQAAKDRLAAEDKYGQVWDTEELQRDFEVLGFLAPCVAVRRKSDGKRGTLMYQHYPRFYYGWMEDR